MPWSRIVVPTPIKSAKILRYKEHRPFAKNDLTDSPPDDYQAGFEHGYKAGMWLAQQELLKYQKEHKRARQELEIELERRGKQADALMDQMSRIHEALHAMVQIHFPSLLQEILDRLFIKHPFSAQELADEIKALISDLSHADHVHIDCSPEDHRWLENNLVNMNLDVKNLKLDWRINPDLKPGEFLLHSDLGEVDGRRFYKQQYYRDSLAS